MNAIMSIDITSEAAPAALLGSAPPSIFGRTEASERSRASRERRRKLGRNLRHAALLAALLAAGIAAVIALRPRSVAIDAARVDRGPLVVAIEETGMTRVKDRYVVSAPATGRVSRLPLEPGDTVQQGDTLLDIAPALSPLLDERTRAEAEARLGAAVSALGQARAQASRANAAKELAEQDLLRARRLADSNSLPRHDLEQAEFAARMREDERKSAEFASKVAAEEVRIARAALGDGGPERTHQRHAAVVSPISGHVLRVHQKSAGVVQAGSPLLEVGDPRALEVVVDLLTTDAVQVSPGTPVLVQGWGGSAPLAGKVRRIEPAGFTRPSALGVDEQRVNVIVTLTDPPERFAALGDGYHVEARLVLWRAERVLKVPDGAVFKHGDDWAVYRVEDDVARLTRVRIGHRGERDVEITRGLSEGVMVAVHPGDRVKDGVRVEAR
jgi:HlyD family secretion protein